MTTAQRAARVRAHTTTDEWWTPLEYVTPLGAFDLDPCAPVSQSERTGAGRSYTSEDDGLAQPWSGRVWLNPPYSNAGRWVARLAEHGDGIALVFVRCETRWWHEHVWPKADAILFLKGRLSFVKGDGPQTGHNAAAPSCYVAYGADNVTALEGCGIPGKLVRL